MTEVLQLKYRPQALDQVIGQDAAVAALAQVIERKQSQAFLFTGPAGCGKTSLARIVADMMGCGPADIVETNAGNHNGIDDMREITDGLRFKPLDSSRRALLLNEVHALSKAAWNSVLTVIEEPPKWAVWLLTTTDSDKVPEAVVTRCTRVDVKPVPWQVLVSDLLRPVAENEGMEVQDAVLGMCAREARGSPRQALVNLSTCAGAASEDAAALLLRAARDSGEGVDLARALWDGKPWEVIAAIIESLEDANPESVRKTVLGYSKAVVLNKKNHKNPKIATRGLAIMDAFSQPMYNGDGVSQVLLAAGRLVLLS